MRCDARVFQLVLLLLLLLPRTLHALRLPRPLRLAAAAAAAGDPSAARADDRVASQAWRNVALREDVRACMCAACAPMPMHSSLFHTQLGHDDHHSCTAKDIGTISIASNQMA